MTRRLRFLFFWILLLAAITSLAAKKLASDGGRLPGFGNEAVDIPETAIARTVFMIGKDAWTTFRIPSHTNRLTLLSRAHFLKEESTLVDGDFPYTIGYRIERLDGATVEEGTFDLRAHFIPMVNDAGQPEPAAFFRDRKAVLSTSRTSTLEFEPGDLLILRIHLESYHPDISGVSIRAFQTRELDQNRPAYLWNRLNQQSLNRIAERRVHNLSDISPEEQLSILRNRPVPLGAYGIEGRDFDQATLYIRNDLTPARRELIEPLGVGEVRCSPALRSVIGVPHPGGKVRIKLNRTDRTENPGDGEIIVRHFGETIHERDEFRIKLGASFAEFSRELKPGLIEIESPAPVLLRPYFQPPNEPEAALEINSSLVRTWRIDHGQPATFSRGGGSRDSGFFRISARPAGTSSALIRYTLIDDSGTTLSSGSRQIEALPSLYDFEVTEETELPVNEPLEVVLALSPEVGAVRIESDEAFLLSGYSRPARLVHQTRVPADYIRALPDPDRIPVWFGLRPDHADQMIRSHRSHLLQVQARPPEDDADILAGKYQWEDFQPRNGLGQYILCDRDPDSPARIESLPSLFAPLADGAAAPVYPESPPGLSRPARNLAFFRDGRDPADLTVYVDGSPFFNRQLVTSCGEMSLPAFPVTMRNAHIQSNASGINCFINYIKPETATKLKRRAQRVSVGDRLEYLCEKMTSEEELLTGMMFTNPDNSRSGSTTNSEVTVSIFPGPTEGAAFLPESDNFTIRNRSFVISADSSSETAVLGGAIGQVDAGRRFFIPLGRDMPPGTWVIIITYEDGPGGYLTLSKVLGGEYSEARFFRETSR